MNETKTMSRRLAPNVMVIQPIFERIRQDLKDDVKQQKLRVAAYARVSTEQDEQKSSYEAQVDYYTRFIKNHDGWELAGVFADRGITGTNTKNRDEFNKMIDLAMNGSFDLILTKSISRFARNTVDTLQTVRKLKEVGVEVIFEKENLHSLDPKGEVMLTIMSSLAQEESRSISENVRWGKKQSMESGNVYMPYDHFLGYRKGEDGRPEIVEEEAVIIREIYNSFLAGKSISQIAEDLTARGVLTPGGKKKWSISTVRGILGNEKYKGEAILQKTFTVDYFSKKVRKNNGEKPIYVVSCSHEPIRLSSPRPLTASSANCRADVAPESAAGTWPTPSLTASSAPIVAPSMAIRSGGAAAEAVSVMMFGTVTTATPARKGAKHLPSVKKK